MRLATPPIEATRFFAKVESSWLECPRCGYLLYFQTLGRKGTRAKGNAPWDHRTAVLGCPACLMKFVIGLLAWPVAQSSQARTAPRDQVPNERQLAQLRAMKDVGSGKETGAGWWMPQAQARRAFRAGDTNITAACTCRPGLENTSARDLACPIHGGELDVRVPAFVDDDGNPI